ADLQRVLDGNAVRGNSHGDGAVITRVGNRMRRGLRGKKQQQAHGDNARHEFIKQEMPSECNRVSFSSARQRLVSRIRWKYPPSWSHRVFLSAALAAISWIAAQPAAAVPKFEIEDGDRIVWIGNTLVEREQRYGYWE